MNTDTVDSNRNCDTRTGTKDIMREEEEQTAADEGDCKDNASETDAQQEDEVASESNANKSSESEETDNMNNETEDQPTKGENKKNENESDESDAEVKNDTDSANNSDENGMPYVSDVSVSSGKFTRGLNKCCTSRRGNQQTTGEDKDSEAAEW